MKNLEQLKKKHAELGEEIARLEEQGNRQHKPTEDNLGYLLYGNGVIIKTGLLDNSINYYKSNSWFATEEEAEKELEKRKAIARVKEFIVDNGLYFDDIDWENQFQHKYYFYFHNGDKEVSFSYTELVCMYSPIGYLKNKEDAEKVVENCKDDLELIISNKKPAGFA